MSYKLTYPASRTLGQAEPAKSKTLGIIGPILIIGFAFWIFKAYRPKPRRR